METGAYPNGGPPAKAPRLTAPQREVLAFMRRVHPEPVYGVDDAQRRTLKSLARRGLVVEDTPEALWVVGSYRLPDAR